MTEHRAPNFLILLMAGFLFCMTIWALGFWMLSLAFGVPSTIEFMGFAATAIFATLHIPTAIIGVLLLQWRRPVLQRTHRIALEAATLYFGLAVLIGIFFNYLAASLLDELL